MKIAFLGSPPPAVPVLERLLRDGHDIVTVVTPPNRKRGRGGKLVATAVGETAERLGLPVVHRLADCDFATVDLAVIVAFGRIIPSSLLERVPMINVHFSLLPRWRGAAPVERAILAGDHETGVCIMGVAPELDTGPVYARATTLVGEKTSAELLDELARMGAESLSDVVKRFDEITPVPQVGTPSYAEKLTPADFLVSPDMTADHASRVMRLGRTRLQVGTATIKVHRARVHPGDCRPGVAAGEAEVLLGCNDGCVALEIVQPDGGRPMSAAEWWRGQRFDDAVSWSPVTRP